MNPSFKALTATTAAAVALAARDIKHSRSRRRRDRTLARACLFGLLIVPLGGTVASAGAASSQRPQILSAQA